MCRDRDGGISPSFSSSLGQPCLSVQTLEPAWENSTIKQVVGRASRYKSHSHLPLEERKVRVEHYHSTLPGEHSIDEYLHMMAKEKEKTSKPLWDLIKRHGYQIHMPKP